MLVIFLVDNQTPRNTLRPPRNTAPTTDMRDQRASAKRAYMPEKPFLSPPAVRSTLSMLKRTVFEIGRHCPARISSPCLTRKAGETWIGVFLWRFSKRWYFLIKWR